MTERGFCECGCGQRTRIARRTCKTKGWVRGEPLRFAAPGHNARVTNHPWRQITAADYTVEARGYQTPCWIWVHRVSKRSGHALVMVGTRRIGAHCANYEQLVGPIPQDHGLHHLCEQPACVNPEHLQPLTRREHIVAHVELRRRRRELQQA